jgi:hypothetical protein
MPISASALQSPRVINFIFGILSSYFSHAAGRPIQAAMVSSHQT